MTMRQKILDILEKHYHGRNFIEERCADDLLSIIDIVTSYDEGFEQGLKDGWDLAIGSIRNNYEKI